MVTAVGDEARRSLRDRAGSLDADKLASLSPLLIIVPHADDEVLGCGGLIAEASDLKLHVRVVYLTDGSASHRGSPTWPPGRLASARRDEALRALDVLGVGAGDVLFLDWPDAEPYPTHSPAFAQSVEAVFLWDRGTPPRSLWAPFEGEGHCDHQAAWALASAVRRRWTSPPPLFEYLVWAWNTPDLSDILSGRSLWSLACERHIARRRSALACHATQHGALIEDAVAFFALPATLTALTDCPTEIFLER